MVRTRTSLASYLPTKKRGGENRYFKLRYSHGATASQMRVRRIKHLEWVGVYYARGGNEATCTCELLKVHDVPFSYRDLSNSTFLKVQLNWIS